MTGRLPASLRLYGLAAGAGAVLAPAWLRDRVRRGKEDPARWPERMGRTGAVRPEGRLVWLHGVSVGESLSLLPLVERMGGEAPDVSLLVTSGTRASAELLSGRLPPGVRHQYAPLDTPGAVRRFLEHWRPELGVFVESELWPNLILAARRRGLRLALVSARLSDRSLAGWRRAPAAAQALLGAFDLVLARDSPSQARLASLGARVDGLADLKFGAAPLPVDDLVLAQARASLGGRPVLLAASTHPGEDAAVLKAFAAVRREEGALLVIAPRHPARGEAVRRLALDRGLDVGRRAAGDPFGESAVYVADTVGELGLWYRLASLAVVGGSLVPGGVGGHNPMEPARLGCPFITGPEVSAWPVYEALEAAGATARVPAAALAAWFARAIEGDVALATMAAQARAFVESGDAAAAAGMDRVMDMLAP